MKKLLIFGIALFFVVTVKAQGFSINFLDNTFLGTKDSGAWVKAYIKNETPKDVIYQWSFSPKGWEWDYDWEYYIKCNGEKSKKGDESGMFEVSAGDSTLLEIRVLPTKSTGTGKLFYSFVGSDDPFSIIEGDVAITISEKKGKRSKKRK